MSFSSLLPTLIGGFLLGFVFSGFNLPLPVPPLAGIIAGLACLAGSTTFDFVRHHFMSIVHLRRTSLHPTSKGKWRKAKGISTTNTWQIEPIKDC